MSTLGGFRSEDDANRDILRDKKHWADHGFGIWMFFDKENDKFVGRGGPTICGVDGKDECVMNYAVVPEYWGKGFATEIGKHTVSLAFNELHQSSMVSYTLPINHKSIRVMEKLGFKYEKDIRHANLFHKCYRKQA